MGTKTQVVHIAKSGGVDVLKLQDRTLEAPGPGELQIRIEAAGVAYADIVMRRGVYPGVRIPFIPGYDCVGVVAAIGPGVTGFTIGQRIVAVTVTGCYARHRNVPAAWAVPAPDGVAAEKIVAAAMNGLTAVQMMKRMARPSPGEWVLVHGAAGGMGTLLLDLARHHGARAVGTASSAKHRVVEARGAVAVDYKSQDFVARVRNITGREGTVAAFDHVGGSHLRRSISTLRPGGTAVAYGFYDVTKNGRVDPLAYLAMRAGSFVDSFALFSRGISLATYNVNLWRDSRPAAYRHDLAATMALLADGALRPEIADVLPLERAAEAQSLLERSAGIGKFVLAC